MKNCGADGHADDPWLVSRMHPSTASPAHQGSTSGQIPAAATQAVERYAKANDVRFDGDVSSIFYSTKKSQ
jgi:hypothetical protein